MSRLGTLARVSPELLEQLRSPEAKPYEVLSEHETQIDLDKSWDVLRFLLDEAGVPVNPMRSGRLYPSAERAWGHDQNSCLLTVEEVRRVWRFLEATPFRNIAMHLRAGIDTPLYPGWQLDDPLVRRAMEPEYEAMVELFGDAAAAGECVVFWEA
jgi:hypothetical protein